VLLTTSCRLLLGLSGHQAGNLASYSISSVEQNAIGGVDIASGDTAALVAD
jgi:hypothetical protein